MTLAPWFSDIHHGRKPSDIPRLLRDYGIGIGGYHMTLLLRDHKFLCSAKNLWWVRHRYRYHRRIVLWEPVGATKYAYLWVY